MVMVVHTASTGLQNVRVGKAVKFKALLNTDIQIQHSLDDLNHATSQPYASSDTDNVQSACCGVRSSLFYVKFWSLSLIYYS